MSSINDLNNLSSENKTGIDSKSVETVIDMIDISKIYKTGSNAVEALKHISLNIQKGELLVILGPSGSGKTTLLNIIGGIDFPTNGVIKVDNLELSNKKQMEKVRKEKIGFIFQFFNLLPNLTAQENVEYVLELLKKRNRKYESHRYLKIMGLEDRTNHFPSQLSGGEQQRVAIARALAKEPLVILADEPTGELDYETGIMILDILSELVDKYNTTVIIVTHNQEISRIADRIIRLSSGQICSIIDNRMSKVSPDELKW